ncbi:uncharacterized protein LOC111377216 [Olea europaea var. sylvestris]|uniref:uncharacterized protein LOC111377216 n=1 Tax=Olea europaea var. sylvestris TaxID=158386 RepID=UPI000C1D530A|nr:uncharacterized protein LOC111377216 [Olea europaea var. sylvestris]
MITRDIDIVNGLKGFDRKFTNGELVSKMLRFLSEEWSPLRMLIENTKDVNIYPLEELYSTLMTYELNNADVKEKMRKSLHNNRRFQKKEEKGEDRNKKIVCYDCDKSGHQRTECPNKKKNFKKKVLQATWDDSDDKEPNGNDSQDEVENMCFMVIKDKVPKKIKSKWFLDSGCTKHMTGDRSLLSNFQEEDGGHVTFGDNTKDNLGKFESKSDIGIFLGYSSTSKAYRVFNKRTLVVEESMHVTSVETNSSDREKGSDNDVGLEAPFEQMKIQDQNNEAPNGEIEKSNAQENEERQTGEQSDPSLPKEWRFVPSHPK